MPKSANEILIDQWSHQLKHVLALPEFEDCETDGDTLKQIIYECAVAVYAENKIPDVKLHFAPEGQLVAECACLPIDSVINQALIELNTTALAYLYGGAHGEDDLLIAMRDRLSDLDSESDYASLPERLYGRRLLKAANEEPTQETRTNIKFSRYRLNLQVGLSCDSIQQTDALFFAASELAIDWHIEFNYHYRNFHENYRKEHGDSPKDYKLLTRVLDEQMVGLKKDLPLLCPESVAIIRVAQAALLYFSELKDKARMPVLETMEAASPDSLLAVMPVCPQTVCQSYKVDLPFVEICRGLSVNQAKTLFHTVVAKELLSPNQLDEFREIVETLAFAKVTEIADETIINILSRDIDAVVDDIEAHFTSIVEQMADESVTQSYAHLVRQAFNREHTYRYVTGVHLAPFEYQNVNDIEPVFRPSIGNVFEQNRAIKDADDDFIRHANRISTAISSFDTLTMMAVDGYIEDEDWQVLSFDIQPKIIWQKEVLQQLQTCLQFTPLDTEITERYEQTLQLAKQTNPLHQAIITGNEETAIELIESGSDIDVTHDPDDYDAISLAVFHNRPFVARHILNKLQAQYLAALREAEEQLALVDSEIARIKREIDKANSFGAFEVAMIALSCFSMGWTGVAGFSFKPFLPGIVAGISTVINKSKNHKPKSLEELQRYSNELFLHIDFLKHTRISHTQNGLTSLIHFATQLGHREIVEFLLQFEPSNAMAQDSLGDTALMLAIKHQQCHLYDLFIAKTTQNSINNAGESLLLIAARYGEEELVHQLLALGFESTDYQRYCEEIQPGIISPAILQPLNDDNLSLFAAVHAGRVEQIEYWLNQAVDLNNTDESGKTVYHLAIDYDDLLLLKHFLQRNKKSNYPEDLLVYAQFKKSKACADYLAKTKYFSTAIESDLLVSEAGNQTPEIFKLLDCENLDEAVRVAELIKERSEAFWNKAIFEKDANGDCLLDKISEPFFLRILNIGIPMRDKDDYTVIVGAAHLGFKQAVTWALEHGCTINDATPHGQTALIAASVNQHLALVKYLCEQYNPDLNRHDRNGYTALHCAIMQRNTELALYLIEQGANTALLGRDGHSALSLAVKRDMLAVVKALSINPELLSRINHKGQGLLHLAAVSADPAMIDFLISKGLDIHLPTGANHEQDEVSTQQSALHLAALNGRIDNFTHLISLGADYTLKNAFGETPLMILNAKSDNILKFIQSHQACYDEQLLNTYFLLAAGSNNVEMMEWLISICVDLYSVDINGNTALHHAIMRGAVDSIHWLLAHGFNVHQANNQGELAIHFAAQQNHGHIIMLFNGVLEFPDWQQIDGKAALHLACEFQAHCAIVALMSLGASPSLRDLSGLLPEDYLNEDSNLLALLAEGSRYTSSFVIEELSDDLTADDASNTRNAYLDNASSVLSATTTPVSDRTVIAVNNNESSLYIETPSLVPLTDEKMAEIKARFATKSTVVAFPLNDDELDSLLEQYNAILLSDINLTNKIGKLATIRRAVYQSFAYNPYDTQMLVLLALINYPSSARGRLAQVKTGEGKSLIIAMLAAYEALSGNKVDVITSSRPLAIRDAEKFTHFYQILGLTVSAIGSSVLKTEYFTGQIVYGTNSDMEWSIQKELIYEDKSRLHQGMPRPCQIAIVDESDNLLIDTALNATRLTIAAPEDYSWIYQPIYYFLMQAQQDSLESEDFNIEPDDLVALLREHLTLLHDGAHQPQLVMVTDDQLIEWIKKVCVAHEMLEESIDYQITHQHDDNEIKKKITIVDYENTGRQQTMSRWDKGLHEFIEVKHGIKPGKENICVASLSRSAFYQDYQVIYGLTGTCGNDFERHEIRRLYQLDLFDAPTHRANVNQCLGTSIQVNTQLYYRELLMALRKQVAVNRPVLVLCLTIVDSEKIYQLIKALGFQVQLLNENQMALESFVIEQAGQPGMITVATNTASRGTDIVLNAESIAKGGLHVIMTFYAMNMRVEQQAIGRAARQGQPGSHQYIYHIDDKQLTSLCPDKVLRRRLVNAIDEFNERRFISNQLISQLREENAKSDREIHKRFMHYATQTLPMLKQCITDLDLDATRSRCADFVMNDRVARVGANLHNPLQAGLAKRAMGLLIRQEQGDAVNWQLFLQTCKVQYLQYQLQIWAVYYTALLNKQHPMNIQDFPTYDLDSSNIDKSFQEFVGGLLNHASAQYQNLISDVAKSSSRNDESTLRRVVGF